MAVRPDPARLLAVSPHLDDAVLSFGAGLARMTQAGARVTVHTVFAGTAPPPYSPAAQRMHAAWGLGPDDDAPLHRRKEDVAALGQLGVGHRHGPFLDSLYRRRPDGGWEADHVPGGPKLSVPRRPPEQVRALVSEIRQDIESAIDECAPELLLTCAASGGHPDNEMTRDAALFAAAAKGVPVRLWEDLPFAVTYPEAPALPEGFRLGPPRFEALRHYVSQLAVLDGPGKDLFGQLEDHARKAAPRGGYGETTWPVRRHED